MTCYAAQIASTQALVHGARATEEVRLRASRTSLTTVGHLLDGCQPAAGTERVMWKSLA
jgi:hypothetical protein